MKKNELVAAILNDMYKNSNASPREIDRRFKGWLNKQNKSVLEGIAQNRGITE